MPFIQDQNKIREDYKLRKKISQVKLVLNSRQTKGILILLVLSILVPVLIYYFIFDKGTYPEESKNTCSIDKTYRIPCGKVENVTFDYCNDIKCCFDNSTKLCFHYLPSKYYYFDTSGNAAYQKSLAKSPFGRDQLKTIALTVHQIDKNNLQIILHDSTLTFKPTTDLKDTNYYHSISKDPLYIEVFRNQTKDLLLTTAKGPTIASENYWEWSFQLTDKYLFGLGQTLIDLDENSTLTKVIYGNDKDHNTLPLFMGYKNGNWHGLVVRHNGPLEVTVFPSKLVSLKCLAGNQITLELSVGPSVKEVVQQQNRGKDWVSGVNLGTFGVHICREGTTTSLREILEEYQSETSNTLIEVEYASDCMHENLLLALRNEEDIVNNAYVDTMNQLISDFSGYSFTLALPPQVPFQSQFYNNTAVLNLFFKNSTGNYVGEYLKTKVVYPNFQHPLIDQFVQKLLDEIESYFEIIPNQFVLTENWPSDESFQMTETKDFQYLSKNFKEAMSFTLPWNVDSNSRLQYLDHNDYGSSQLNQMQTALSEATFMTTSHNFDTIQPIMVQNVDISWTNFQKAITTTLYNGIFGLPLTSFPVCGSTNIFDSTYESLCLRWYYMAATAPIFRLSSDSPRRDPNSLALIMSNYLATNAKWALDFRNSLKYYFYGVLSNGEPLMRPMFYDFPNDVQTFALVEQYMVGKDLLVAQPTLPDQSLLKVYLPKEGRNWFEFWGGAIYDATDEWISLSIVETDWVGFIREGSVIPLVEKNLDENYLEVKLKVALICEDNVCSASGILKTDTNNVTFVSTDEGLTVEAQQSENFVLTQVEIFKIGFDSVRYSAIDVKDLSEIGFCSYSVEEKPILQC